MEDKSGTTKKHPCQTPPPLPALIVYSYIDGDDIRVALTEAEFRPGDVIEIRLIERAE